MEMPETPVKVTGIGGGVAARRQVWMDPLDTSTSTRMPDTGMSTRPTTAGDLSGTGGSFPGSGDYPSPGGALGTVPSECGDSPDLAVTGGSRSGSPAGELRSKRFSREERSCFRHRPLPSAHFHAKQLVYWQTQGQARKALVAEGWAGLPVMKGKFYTHPSLAITQEKTLKNKRSTRRTAITEKSTGQLLPNERQTAEVLEDIFPCSPSESQVQSQLRSPQASKEPTQAERMRAALVAKSSKTGHAASGQDQENHALEVSMDPGSPIGLFAQDGQLDSTSTVMPARPQARPLSSTQARPQSSPKSQPQAQRQVAAAANSSHNSSSMNISSFNNTNNTMRNANSMIAMPSSPEKGASAKLAGAKLGATQGKEAQASQVGTPSILTEFREALLESFSNLREAYDTFSQNVLAGRELAKPEWRHLLHKHGFVKFIGRKAVDEIFKFLDVDGSGTVSLQEFYIALEMAGPVRSCECLRRKWLAHKYKSMTQAIRKLDDEAGVSSDKRLDQEEFAGLMERTGILDGDGFQGLFQSLSHVKSHTVAIEELHCAIATVSPPLVLEELRERVEKRFRGDFDKAFVVLVDSREGSVDLRTWTQRLYSELDFTKIEAAKSFRDIDIDNSGTISIDEFKSAMNLVKPSIFLEDLRYKVRQRFRSIEEELNKTFSDEVLDGMQQDDGITKAKFQTTLETLGLTNMETSTMFELIDTNGDGQLTPLEFVKGVRRFAPACVLEDLRIRCCQQHVRVQAAFADMTRRNDALQFPEFVQKLQKLGLVEAPGETGGTPGLNVQGIFDLLDVNHYGLVTMGRLVVALCACGCGSYTRLPSKELNKKAKNEILSDTRSTKKKMTDFKRQVRYGMEWDEQDPDRIQGLTEQLETEKQSKGRHKNDSVATPASPQRQGSKTPTVVTPTSPQRPQSQQLTRSASAPSGLGQPAGGGRPQSAAGARGVSRSASAAKSVNAGISKGRSLNAKSAVNKVRMATQEELPDYVKAVPTLHADCKTRAEKVVLGTLDEYSNICKKLDTPTARLAPTPAMKKDIHEYFTVATMTLSQDVPLMQPVQSRLATYHSTRMAAGRSPSKGKLAK